MAAQLLPPVSRARLYVLEGCLLFDSRNWFLKCCDDTPLTELPPCEMFPSRVVLCLNP